MRKLKLLGISLASLAILLTTSSIYAEAEYYTWVDENGVTNFSERSPEGYEAEHVTSNQRFGVRRRERGSRPAPVASPGVQSAATAVPGVDPAIDPDAAAADERAAIKAELDQIKAENCQIGKQNLARLEAYSRIKVRDDNGDERFLTDEEKTQRAEEARALIRDNCKSG